jgi:hypothetical protein
MDVKSFLRNTLQFFHLDFSKNLQYDRLTKAILKKVLRTDSHCIDVGAHKGELLALLLQSAPNGKHWAFEPLPAFHQQLQAKYGSNPNLTILPFALSNQNGQTSFQHMPLKTRKLKCWNCPCAVWMKCCLWGSALTL